MPDLESVWRAVFPAASRHGEDAALGRRVGWVRVLKARVPAFDALEPDDLAILPVSTLRALSRAAAEPGAVIEAVAAARAAGVVLVRGDEPGDDLSPLVLGEGARAGLAAFDLPAGDAGSLERAVIGYLVNARAELERQAAVLEAELQRVALEGREIEAHAAAIGRFLGRAVAIEAAGGRPLAVHAPADGPGAGPDVARYVAGRRGPVFRMPLPAPWDTGSRGDVPGGQRRRDAGALVLIGVRHASELEETCAARVAGLLAIELQRAGDGWRRPSHGSAERLPPDGPPWVVLVARQWSEPDPQPVADRERVRLELRRLAPARRLTLRGDTASLELRLVASPGEADPLGLGLAERVARIVERPVAVSRPFAHPDERPVAEAQARATLEAVEALREPEQDQLARMGTDADGPRGQAGSRRGGASPALGAKAARRLVAREDLLPAYRLLSAVHAVPDGGRLAGALLAPLLSGRPARDAERLATLRAVLDHPGLAEAAAALAIHRNTLNYRLARIEALTGWRLDDPTLRFSLAVAVRIVQNDQRQMVPQRR